MKFVTNCDCGTGLSLLMSMKTHPTKSVFNSYNSWGRNNWKEPQFCCCMCRESPSSFMEFWELSWRVTDADLSTAKYLWNLCHKTLIFVQLDIEVPLTHPAFKKLNSFNKYTWTCNKMQHTCNSSLFEHVRNTNQPTFGIPNLSIQRICTWAEICLRLQIINH